MIVQADLEARIPEEYLNTVAEYIARINYRLRLGRFILDMDDGFVAFNYTIDVEDGELTPIMVLRAISLALHTLEEYRSGLFAILFRGASAQDALKQNSNASGDEVETPPVCPPDCDNGTESTETHE